MNRSVFDILYNSSGKVVAWALHQQCNQYGIADRESVDCGGPLPGHPGSGSGKAYSVCQIKIQAMM